MPESTHPITLTSRTYRVYAVALWLLLAAIAVTLTVGSSGSADLAALPTLAVAALLTLFGLWMPSYTVDDDGVTVRNVWSSVRINWDSLVNVGTKWSLTLQTPHLSVPVFAAPQPGRFVSWRVQRRVVREGSPAEKAKLAKAIHVGELPGTESGDGAELIRERWQAALHADRVAIGTAEDVVVERQWHTGRIAICVVSIVAALALAWLLGTR